MELPSYLTWRQCGKLGLTNVMKLIKLRILCKNFRYVRKEYADIRTVTKLAIQHLDWRDYKEDTLPRYENIYEIMFLSHFICISPTLLTLRNNQLTGKLVT